MGALHGGRAGDGGIPGEKWARLFRTFRRDEPMLDQLFSEPIVQQLMRRDPTDEASIRQLLQEAAAVRLTSRENYDPNT